MDDTIPQPRTARKTDEPLASRSVSSLTSYPEIPCRRSSLSASVSNDSTGPATSTRTPSLSDSLYQIQVAKVRQPIAAARRDMYGGDLGGMDDDPFVDEIRRSLPETPQHQSRNRSELAPQLTVRWSSGSWDPTGPCLPSSSTSDSGDPHADLRQHSARNSSQPRPVYLYPMDLPISFVHVRSAASQPQIPMLPGPLWTTVHVSADVSSIPFSGTAGLAPLDIIILLDNAPFLSIVPLLTQFALKSLVLASNLIHNHDRVALAYVGGAREPCFVCLLPLDFHSLDDVRSAVNIFQKRQPMKTRFTKLDIGTVIQKVSRLFEVSPRAAFCHLVFVSATPREQLSLPWIDQAIGFHTMTTQACLPLRHVNLQPGWHISYDMSIGDACPEESHFVHKVARVVRQLRTGIRPGSIVNVKLSIMPAGGCQIHSVVDNSRLTCLRPGETWMVPVLIDVPAAFQQPMSPATEQQFFHPTIAEMLSEINTLMVEYASDEITQPILTAHVEYQHSLLPASNIVHVETHLTVIRSEKRTLYIPQYSGGPSMATIGPGNELGVNLSSQTGT